MLQSKNLGKKWYINGLNLNVAGAADAARGRRGLYLGYKPEIKFIANFLKMPTGQLRHKFLRRVGLRTSIIEDAASKDCIFLQNVTGQKQCSIYPVRPNQCRTWPFWPENLATTRCMGKNQQEMRRCQQRQSTQF